VTTANELISAESAASYLRGRGLAGSSDEVEVVELGGGVSNVTLAIRLPRRRVVLKQALPALRVTEHWPAKRERAITEAVALTWAAGLTPEHVPAVLDADEKACALVVEHAPDGWTDWKSLLLEGQASEPVARRLGSVLATWHVRSAARPDERFDDPEAFEQLRVDPYYRTTIGRHPELQDPMTACMERMLATRACFVHGDFSPKNVLADPDGVYLWVIDFEVAHLGDPVFDVAFMLNHLMLKALHRPQSVEGYRKCAFAFLEAYSEASGGGPAVEDPYLFGHLGCLMVARVDGKSPAEYLTVDGRAMARKLGSTLLLEEPATLAEAWQRLTNTLAEPRI
jgi:aminoglycoside phosphotransferase (APT) family kinase protein